MKIAMIHVEQVKFVLDLIVAVAVLMEAKSYAAINAMIHAHPTTPGKAIAVALPTHLLCLVQKIKQWNGNPPMKPA
jgi:hypothetical protein